MAGGEIVVTSAENAGIIPEEATVVGNTCLYGATGGQLFARGKAGERFAVGNSLAEAVVEGTGDHCCEYMTGGCVVVFGKNVVAGMTGGLAYLLDEDDSLIPKEFCVANSWFKILSVIHMMDLLTLIEANSLLMPKGSSNSSERLISADCMMDVVDLLLKAYGYLDFCVRKAIVHLPADIRERLANGLPEGGLAAIYIQALC